MVLRPPVRRLTVRRAGSDGEDFVLRVSGAREDWIAWAPPGEPGRPVDAREVRQLVIAAAGGLDAPLDVHGPPLVLQAEELRELAASALEHERSVSVPDSVRPLLGTLRGVVDAQVTDETDQVVDSVSWLDGGPAGCWIVEPAEEGRVVLAPGRGELLVQRLLKALAL